MKLNYLALCIFTTAYRISAYHVLKLVKLSLWSSNPVYRW